MVCTKYGFRKQWYYEHKLIAQKKSEQDLELLKAIREVRKDHAEYGIRKVQYELEKTHNIKISLTKLLAFLHKHHLMSISCRRRRSFSRSRSSARYPNLLAQTSIKHTNQAWAADITYITSGLKTLYLSMVIDIFSRMIIGYDLSDSLKANGIIRAFRMALSTVESTAGIIHHSDKGTQYTSIEYQQMLLLAEMRISQTGINKCYDNAKMERVNGTLKVDLRCAHVPGNIGLAKKKINEAVFYYNVERIHQSLGYLTPQVAYRLGLAMRHETERAGNKVACT
jgi:putative transposase